MVMRRDDVLKELRKLIAQNGMGSRGLLLDLAEVFRGLEAAARGEGRSCESVARAYFDAASAMINAANAMHEADGDDYHQILHDEGKLRA